VIEEMWVAAAELEEEKIIATPKMVTNLMRAQQVEDPAVRMG
jgi:hypothetical protein